MYRELAFRAVGLPSDQNVFAAERRKLYVGNGNVSAAFSVCSADACAVNARNGLEHITLNVDAFAVLTRCAADRRAGARCGNRDLAASDADRGVAADACRAAVSCGGDASVGDADAADSADPCRRNGFSSVLTCSVLIGSRFYLAPVDDDLCFGSGAADARALSGGGRLYLAAVDGDRPVPIRPDPVSKYEGILSIRKVVDAACRRYRTAVDGDAAVPPCGDRAVGGFGNDRAAVDGNAAAISGTAAANSHAESIYSVSSRDRFGTDDAAVDGNAAAQSLFGGVSAGVYACVILERSADRRCAILSSGADIAAVDDDRTLAFVDSVVGLLPAHASANTGQPIIGPYNIINAPVAVEILRKARRQLAHGVLAGALGIDGEGIALLHIDAPLRCEVAAVL